MIEMVKNLHWAFEKLLRELSWMDDQTKNKTMHKAKQMNTLVAFPNFIKDPKKLDKYYENVIHTIYIIPKRYLIDYYILLFSLRCSNGIILATS